MKKILPILVVGVLVLSGLGAVAVQDEESIASSSSVWVEFKGGFGVGFTFTNNGSTPYEEEGNITIIIYRLITLKGKYYNYSLPTIPANETVSVRTPPILGFGPVWVKYLVEHPHGESTGNSIGLILGLFVLIGRSAFSL